MTKKQKGYEKCAEYYDFFANNEDIPFYKKFAEKTGSPILDLATGTGRVAIALAKVGYTVYGLDSSPAMLNVAINKRRQLSKEEQKRLILKLGDIIDFKLNKKFQLVIIPNSFGHCLTTEEQLSCLQNIYEHLTKNGLFILDLFPGGLISKKSSFKDEPVKLSNNITIV